MNCVRCGGLMIVDHFQDYNGSYRETWMTGKRCVNCGHLSDGVAEQNRRTQAVKLGAQPSGAPDYQDAEVHLGAEALTRHAA